jgi:hypothetical protein
MESDLAAMVDKTGLVLPLAARLLTVIAESGASQLEISAALSVVGVVRSLLPGRELPDYLRAAPQ